MPRAPHARGRTVDSITRDDVLRILSPIWTTKRETARKVRAIIRSALAIAEAHGHVPVNVAGPAIDGALPKLGTVNVDHHRALPHGEVAAALDAIATGGAGDTTRACLRFLILTAARSGEARGATWAEVDMDAATWTIPGERMKGGAEHRVPLSGAALEAIRAMLPHQREADSLVFPGTRRGKPLSDATMSRCLEAVGLHERATPHGFRSTFRDWCADSGKARELAEACLAHAGARGDGTERAYFRSDLIEARRGIMEAWARYATSATGQVVRLHA